MVRLEPSAQVTVRFTIVSPLCAVVLQVFPEGGEIKMRLYEYKDDIVIEYIGPESVATPRPVGAVHGTTSEYEISPIAGPLI